MTATIAKFTRSLHDSVSAEEWQVRVDLAACYRLVAHYGWDDLIFTHISARVPGPDVHFLINPYGVMFEEMTASSLVKVDLEGKIVSPTDHPINPAGFTIHSAIHAARHDVGCVLHLHTDNGVAVSAQEDGLLPISQTALVVRDTIAYHAYEGIALDLGERERLVRDLGDNSLMLLRNHGTLAAGANIPSAFLLMFFLERACAMQIAALSGGRKLSIPAKDVQSLVAAQGRMGSGSAGALAWPGLLRLLDRKDPGFRN